MMRGDVPLEQALSSFGLSEAVSCHAYQRVKVRMGNQPQMAAHSSHASQVGCNCESVLLQQRVPNSTSHGRPPV